MATLPTCKTPWGSWRVLFRGKGIQVKHITVSPGARFSLQFHRLRTEHWIITSGRGSLTFGNRKRPVKKGNTVFIPVLQKHRLHNTGRVPLVFVEVQMGPYLGEDDIIRIEDDYGRA